MAGFKIEAFTGTLPCRDERLLSESNATIARNQRVQSGALDPINAPLLIKNLLATTKFVYRIPNGDMLDLAASYWIEFADANTNMIRTPVVNDGYKRYYWASPSTGFKYATEAQLIANGAAAGLKGGVPRPTTAVTLDVIAGTGSPAEGELKITRSYVVTFVSTYGEEGAPSPASEATGYESQDWRLRDLPQPVIQSGHTDISYIRIYRTETAASGSTVFNRVVDVLVGQLIYMDRLPSIQVNGQPQLDANENDQPPSMDGLALMPNGVLVGFKGNNLYFSRNYEPHAWPAAYTLAVQHPIVGLAVFGTTCVVCTQGNPVAVTGTSGDTMTLTASDTSMPCVSRQGIVVAPEGVYFPTATGLALYGPSGPAIVTDDVIGRKLWVQNYNPATLDAVLYMGAYVGMRRTASGYSAFHVIAGSVVEIDVQSDFDPVFAGMDVWSGKPWLLYKNKLFDWLPDTTTLRTVTWQSKQFRFPAPVSISCVQVYADGPVQIAVYANGTQMDARNVVNAKPYKIKGGLKTDVWWVTITANVRVRAVLLATSIQELKAQ